MRKAMASTGARLMLERSATSISLRCAPSPVRPTSSACTLRVMNRGVGFPWPNGERALMASNVSSATIDRGSSISALIGLEGRSPAPFSLARANSHRRRASSAMFPSLTVSPAAAILGLQLLRQFAGLPGVGGHQQAIGSAGVFQASGGVEARADNEADALGVHPLEVDVRELEHGAQAGQRVAGQRAQPVLD